MTRRLWIAAALSVPLARAGDERDARAAVPWLRCGARRWIELALATPVCLWCGVAVLRARRRVGADRQSQHVHADRARRGGGVRLQRRRGARARRCFPRRCAMPWAACRVYFEAAAVIVDAHSARPGARAARARPDGRGDSRSCSGWRRRRRAGSVPDGSEDDVPLEHVQVGRSACACGPARRCRSTASCSRARAAVDESMVTRRADARAQAARATRVVGATINGTRRVSSMRAERVGADTLLARIVAHGRRGAAKPRADSAARRSSCRATSCRPSSASRSIDVRRLGARRTGAAPGARARQCRRRAHHRVSVRARPRDADVDHGGDGARRARSACCSGTPRRSSARARSTRSSSTRPAR